MRTPVLLLCLALGACLETQPGARDDDAQSTNGPIGADDASTSPSTTTNPSSEADAATSAPDTAVECLAAGADCNTPGQCCGGTFCSFDPISYMQTGVCTAPLPEGSYCLAPDWCTSGNCRSNTCGSSECLAEGRECQGDWGCCNDQFCSGGPYVYGECHKPRALGEPCHQDGWCQSGLCRDGACAVDGCGALGDGCGGAGDCCSGFCTGSPDSYTERICAQKQGDGEPCWADNDCHSDICRDGQCAIDCQAETEGCWWDNDCCSGTFCEYVEGSDSMNSSQCVPQRDAGGECDWDHACKDGALCRSGKCQEEGCLENNIECYSNAECCTGACSYSAMSYAIGHCFTPLVAGAACEGDAWCQSSKCADGTCQ